MPRARRSNPSLVQMTERGTITIPKDLRARAPKSDVFEVVLRDDGVYELRPRLLTDASQAWFWTEEWQAASAASTKSTQREGSEPTTALKPSSPRSKRTSTRRSEAQRD